MKKFKVKTKFTPLTIVLCVVLVVYVLLLLALFAWAASSASKAYYGDYRSLEPDLVPHNIVGWPKEFFLFKNIKEINQGFADFTLWQMAYNTVLYAVGCSLSKVVVTCVVAYLCARYDNWFSKVVYNIVIVTMIVNIPRNSI